MDREQAMFLLDCHCPLLADEKDPLVEEAHWLAEKDAELSRWYAHARATDAMVSEALRSVPVAEELRAKVLARMAARRADVPAPADELEGNIMRDLRAMPLPPGLRSRVLVAMERSVSRQRLMIPWRRFMLPMAGAAGIALALLWEARNDDALADHTTPLSADLVQAGFIRAYESPLFMLDEKQNDHEGLIQSLEQKGLPCPCCFPPGLNKEAGIGCRELIIQGRRGSLLCFDDPENGTVHLLVFHASDLACDLPGIQQPSIVRQGSWVAARWAHGNQAYFLIGSSNEERLAKLF
jgi:hypothetical protein